MGHETDNPMPDNPDPHEQLRHSVIKCAEQQKGYDIAERVKKATPDLLKRMQNKPLAMMRALLEEWHL